MLLPLSQPMHLPIPIARSVSSLPRSSTTVCVPRQKETQEQDSSSQALQQYQHAGRKYSKIPTLRTDTVKRKRLALSGSIIIPARLDPAQLFDRTLTDTFC